MPSRPHAPIAVNHTIITGPNKRQMAAVPRLWKAKRTTMITAVIGPTHSLNPDWTTLRPSTDEITEIAGVIMLSPKKSEAPKMPRASTVAVRRLPRPPNWRTRVMSAMIPPSPSLSARMMRVT
jgi:hypothetical protein